MKFILKGYIEISILRWDVIVYLYISFIFWIDREEEK